MGGWRRPGEREKGVALWTGGGGGGGGLGLKCVLMYVSNNEGYGSFFQLQVSEMSERISLKMGVNFARRVGGGGGGDLVLTVHGCVCPK